MAADGGALKRLFEKPLPENPTLLEALSAWNHTHRKKLVDPASFTEIFGELHFQENPPVVDSLARAAARPSPSPPPPPPPRRTVSWLDITDAATADNDNDKSKDDSSLDALLKPPRPASGGATVKRSASFCLKSSTSLLLCTEGLGSESTVDADDMVKDGDGSGAVVDSGMDVDDDASDVAAAVAGDDAFGAGGFVLMEVVIPGKDLLRATREGGRLRLQFANAAAAAAAVGVIDDEEMHGQEAAACVGGDTFA
uniref:FAF domain-containing protein n=1 Tax=Oryza glumipatula TaxID=40148 RepID=A0A0E0BFF7_9ORYZ